MDQSDLFKATPYFAQEVLRKRPQLKPQWIVRILREPLRTFVQPDGRVRMWGYIEEVEKYLRVITLTDGETVHNAFFDRRFKGKS